MHKPFFLFDCSSVTALPNYDNDIRQDRNKHRIYSLKLHDSLRYSNGILPCNFNVLCT